MSIRVIPYTANRRSPYAREACELKRFDLAVSMPLAAPAAVALGVLPHGRLAVVRLRAQETT